MWLGMQAGNILLVLAHADSVVKAALGRRDTLLAMFEVMRKLEPTALLKCLKCLKLLTFDPALLQPLQVRAHRLTYPSSPFLLLTVVSCESMNTTKERQTPEIVFQVQALAWF